MGLFAPKYPVGAEPPERESRAGQRLREQQERTGTAMGQDWEDTTRASRERDAAFWDDQAQRSSHGYRA